MRAVNLIPPEERRGDSAPARQGMLAYAVVAVLAVMLAGVVGAVVLDNKVADREAEAAALDVEVQEAQAEAASLTSFTSFQQVRDARVQTVDQLARSRFDWERVLRELSLVLPDHVWLTSLNGSVSPEAGADGSSSELRAGISGPALELSGCGRSVRDVARLVAAVEDIDGVTRVVATDSAKPDAAVQAQTSSDGGAPLTGDNCQTRSTIPQFNLIAAFDGVVVPPASEEVPVTPAPPDDSTTTANDGGVAGAEARTEKQRADISEADEDARNAKNLVPGG